MKIKRSSLIRSSLGLLTFAALLGGATVASAQSQATTQQMRDGDVTRQELAGLDHFLDAHPEIAEQVRKDPSLVNKEEFVENHAALKQYLQEHPEVREELRESPNRMMHQEQRYDRREDRVDRGRDTTRGELSNMDHFLDSHPEIAEQLRKDPSLVNNKEFVKHHAALQQYLGEHPQVSEEIKENPNSFMHREQSFDNREVAVNGRSRGATGTELSSFGEFLGSHGNINGELSKNPSLAKNQEYLENHPALRDYLKDHPNAHKELSENPQAFLQSAQQSVGTSKVAKAAPKLK
jgi:phage-related protein